jgi:hypothetical protein
MRPSIPNKSSTGREYVPDLYRKIDNRISAVTDRQRTDYLRIEDTLADIKSGQGKLQRALADTRAEIARSDNRFAASIGGLENQVKQQETKLQSLTSALSELLALSGRDHVRLLEGQARLEAEVRQARASEPRADLREQFERLEGKVEAIISTLQRDKGDACTGTSVPVTREQDRRVEAGWQWVACADIIRQLYNIPRAEVWGGLRACKADGSAKGINQALADKNWFTGDDHPLASTSGRMGVPTHVVATFKARMSADVPVIRGSRGDEYRPERAQVAAD